ncbi:pilin [Candidatus Nanosynsacchari sp. TM7_ANC_38.39_G1_1]|uniref:pilin n=1 Tax=Candidatus Nanosynsacchari sp. TM7_ANC_38.39_G1_1 TaxID=1986206 RepID=UPI00101CA2F5|nr:pilin [Candidatus Nanosynsacchari sp. TM7_ANC_38.39_G1_1]RYC74183.1 hypothetical protein G1ANC_00114 [Candidatus Nanosynsacchari sp. TM7_ANC_38.39_G1_1]
MKKNILIAASIVALGAVMIALTGVPVEAASCGSAKQCIDQGLTASGASGTPGDLSTILTTVTNILLFLMGAVSVIMIIIGGFRYVTSQGDQTQMQSAKNTILYAVIGVVVSIAAYAIVSFVVAQFV